ncbi:MAG TPA: hypothetical protein VFQ85_05685 [Mycobacteriales bacterium]|jgi:hypothetical protein|nr:hypothetical protein [Mycobacteriales bacterium]
MSDWSGHSPDRPDDPQGPPGTDPALAAPSGPDETGDKTNAPAGPGATSAEDVETELKAAREAGEYAAAVAGVDPDAAAPIPRDATERLAEPGTASSAPAEGEDAPLTADDLSRSADQG